MCGTAAHLVDHVLPDVPMRQWVLTPLRHTRAYPPSCPKNPEIFNREAGRRGGRKRSPRNQQRNRVTRGREIPVFYVISFVFHCTLPCVNFFSRLPASPSPC